MFACRMSRCKTCTGTRPAYLDPNPLRSAFMDSLTPACFASLVTSSDTPLRVKGSSDRYRTMPGWTATRNAPGLPGPRPVVTTILGAPAAGGRSAADVPAGGPDQHAARRPLPDEAAHGTRPRHPQTDPRGPADE